MLNILIAAASLSMQSAPTVSEVTFTGADGLVLTGSLELPAKPNGKLPAVLLLPGSGPTDRDGNSPLAPGIKIDVLKDVADKLASEGIATYRFDKRALPGYRPKWPKTLPELGVFFGYDKFVGDAAGAYKMLQGRPEIDPLRVGVMGHSEGASLALQLGADIKPKALILIGCMGRKMGAVLHDQIAYRIGKQAPTLAATYVGYSDAACAAMATGKPLPPNPPQGLGGLYNVTTANLLGAFCRIDPLDLVKHIDCPVLDLNGEYDLNVSATKDYPRLMGGLNARPRAITEGYIAPKCSHCLKLAKNPDDDAFAGPMDGVSLSKIGTFAKRNL